MAILVTGGTGLVGSRLLQHFADHQVACRALVRGGKSLPAGVKAFEGDILDPASLPQAVEGASTIVHLAAVFRTQDTSLIHKVNLEGIQNLIAAVKKHAPKARFIMASTGLVYNQDASHPGREEDAVAPTLAYPASKVAAEKVLRDSGLTWSILRLPFVYGDKDGHLESLPKLVNSGAFKWHPAAKLSLIHHRDIANVVKLALTGATDKRIVNVSDDAPTSIYELFAIQGAAMAPSSEPLVNPWFGHMDGSLARSLGFRPTIATVYQAAREGIL